MERVWYVLLSAMCGLAMGGFWGTVAWLASADAGLVVGLGLFGFTFLVLLARGWKSFDPAPEMEWSPHD